MASRATSDKTEKDLVRIQAEQDLVSFIRLVHPNRMLGLLHIELIRWWTRPDAKNNQLTLLPREHQKSALIAYRAAWEIVRNPSIRILYISSTANLATKQLKFIKDILTSRQVSKYWPELINKDEGKREKWSETEISVDHPQRKADLVRDPTVFVAGLTTNIVGLHSDISILDDTVVHDTAYTEEGRSKLETQYSFLASIETAGAREWVVGTRYFTSDLYGVLSSKSIKQYDEAGQVTGSEPLFEVFERVVEDSPNRDGTGQYLWPRTELGSGKWFGFNKEILDDKREKYLDKTQFYAQYYNDPNVQDGSGISRDYFQYYDPLHLSRVNGRWTYSGRRLNVFAAIDFAWSLKSEADSTAVVVVGMAGTGDYYILDIDRFKTNQPAEYFKHILDLHHKWDFRKIRAEVTVAQEVIVESLKNDYIKKYGLALSVEPHRPSQKSGNKAERIYNVLQPRYANLAIWHTYTGGCQLLEEELVKAKPPHDDIKDALASCIEICIPPADWGQNYNETPGGLSSGHVVHGRFGGVN